MTPKRKRANSAVPQIETIIDETAKESEPDSPRSKVAEKFLHLQLHDRRGRSESPLEHQAVPHAAKKRQLRDGGAAGLYQQAPEGVHDMDMDMDRMSTLVTPPKDLSPVDRMDDVLEIGETPGAYTSFANRLPSSPPMSPSPSPSPLDLEPQLEARLQTQSQEIHLQTQSREIHLQTQNQETHLQTQSQETHTCTDTRRGVSSQQRPGLYRTASHTSEGRVRKCSLSEEMDAVAEKHAGPHQVRRFSKPAVPPITVPPPPTPLTSPGEEPSQQPLLAQAAARMMSIPTLPLEDNKSPYPASPAKKRKTSPPPPAPSTPTNIVQPTSMEPSSTSSTYRTSTPPIDRVSMTWQTGEITGHLWNPTRDKDDDGEGVNGIGFRPTAATEWKRKESRKKQIAEWKAREAKDERRRRFERRKRDSSGSQNSSTSTTGLGLNLGDEQIFEHTQDNKRARVRFAEVD